MALDRGKFIRKIDEYKKTLPGFVFFIAKNKYLRFDQITFKLNKINDFR